VFAANAVSSKVDALSAQFEKVYSRSPDSAFRIAAEIYRISSANGDQRGVSIANMRYGNFYNLKGSYDSVKKYYKKALAIRQQLHLSEVVSTYYSLSKLYNTLGQKDSSFFFLYEAQKWCETTADKKYVSKIYTYLGGLYLDYNDTVNALRNLLIANNIARQNKDTESLIIACTELGNYHFQREHFDSALFYFKKCETLFSDRQQAIDLPDIYNNIGLAYTYQNNAGLAIAYYHKALSIYSKNKQLNEIALTYQNIGSTYLYIHSIDSSIHYLQAGKKLSLETGDRNIEAKCLDYLADAYSEKGNYKKAFEYRKQFGDLSDSLMNDDKIKQIAEMQAKYETEKKEQQINLLNEKTKRRLAERNGFIAGSAVLLVLLAALGYFYVQRQRLALQNAEIASQRITVLLNEQEIKTYNAMIEGQEEERKRVAEELHDRLGSMLSTVKLWFGALEDKAVPNKEQYTKVNHLLDDAVDEVRKVSHNLSTGMVMSFGLVPALEELCRGIDASGLIKCRLLAYGMDERIDNQKETGIYRMVQELASNILKHAKATRIIIQLNLVENELNVTVEDDGTGFDPTARRPGSGIGLKNLETRAARLGGTYHIDTSPGKGTISIINIPV